MRPLFLSSIAAISFAIIGHAIFADEAYQTDYHHALLGLPQSHATFFHRPSATSKASLLYTLSERLVLGAINPKDGAVVWRQRIADHAQNETAIGLLRTAEGANSLYTAFGEDCQSWDATDGRLVWQWTGAGPIKSLEILEGARDALVLNEEAGSTIAVRKLAAENGAVLWEYSDSSGDLPHAIVASGDSVFYVALHATLLNGFKIKITELSAASGGRVGQPVILGSDSEVPSEKSILHIGAYSGNALLVWADKGSRNLRFNILGTKQIANFNVPTNDGNQLENLKVHGPSSSAAKAHLLVHYQGIDSHWAEVYHITPETTKKAYSLPHVNGKGAFAASAQGLDVFFTRHTALENTLISSEDSAVLKQWNLKSKGHVVQKSLQDVTHAVSEVMSRGGSTFAVRSALVLASGSWQLVLNGETFWVRPEGLAGVTTAAFVEVATKATLAEELATEVESGPLAAYIHRVKRHVRDLQHLPAWAEALPKQLMDRFTREESRSQDQSVHRDTFGFHKLILVATADGRLAALDTGNRGVVVWDIQAVILKAGQKWELLSIEADEATALVRGKGGEFLRIVSKTGDILQYQPGGTVSSLKTTVPIIDASGAETLLAVNNDGTLGDIHKADLGGDNVVITSGADNLVQGWGLTKSSKPTLVWRFTPTVGENVTSITVRPSHDPVASIGKALGDRNVLYKYLNPNILLVTAVETKTSVAKFYLIDSTSGAVLHTTRHSGVDTSKSIVSVMSENWFAYSLFSETSAVTQGPNQINRETAKGYRLVVSELFESPHPNDRGPLGSISNSSSIYPPAEDTMDVPDTPHVISQTFLIPGPISSMSMTSTLQGITTRSILCAIPELNGIFSLPRSFVDPRRPVGRDPTATEIEEGLFRYSPTVEFEPKWMLSHKRDILSTSEIMTSPSLLESTSLVFAFGEIDLFGTRIAPIGAFDILGKGFSKLQLVLTVVALAIGTTLVAPFVRRKQIDGTWKA